MQRNSGWTSNTVAQLRSNFSNTNYITYGSSQEKVTVTPLHKVEFLQNKNRRCINLVEKEFAYQILLRSYIKSRNTNRIPLD